MHIHRLIDILERSKVYIRKGWCRGVDAVDQKGEKTDPTYPLAVAWSLVGAVTRARWENPDSTRVQDMGYLTRRLHMVAKVNPVTFNDAEGRTVDEILALIDAAVASFEQSALEPNPYRLDMIYLGWRRLQSAEDRYSLQEAIDRMQRGFSTGHEARDFHGNPCKCYDPKAACWCLLGSLRASTDQGGSRPFNFERMIDSLIAPGEFYATRKVLSAMSDAVGREGAVEFYTQILNPLPDVEQVETR